MSDDIKTLEQQLAAVKASRLAAQASREDVEKARELSRAIAAEEMAAKDEEAVAEAVATHGDLGVMIGAVYTACGVVIVGRPKALIFRRFQELESTKTKDLEQLVRPCLVHPTKPEFDQICDEQPATLVRCADMVATLAGARGREVQGK